MKPTRTWRIRTRDLPLGPPLVMGILNVTPDSFSDGGQHLDLDDALSQARRLVDRGADIIDVGGESTRPGADAVSEEDELRRILPVVEHLAGAGIVISVDTMKPSVADRAVAAGAHIINDVGGMADPDMRAVAASTGAGVVLMHMQGTPRTMQNAPSYVDVVADVGAFLDERAQRCVDDGVDPRSVSVDPGIGFGKTIDHNLQLLGRLDEIVARGWPVTIGVSRKRFIGDLLDIGVPSDRDRGSAVVAAMAVRSGAQIVRVHEPAVTKEATSLAWAIVVACSPTQTA